TLFPFSSPYPLLRDREVGRPRPTTTRTLTFWAFPRFLGSWSVRPGRSGLGHGRLGWVVVGRGCRKLFRHAGSWWVVVGRGCRKLFGVRENIRTGAVLGWEIFEATAVLGIRRGGGFGYSPSRKIIRRLKK